MPGADRDLVLTRLGIAQIGLKNYDAARETLGKVTGARMPVARLWSAFARQQASASAAATTPAALS